MTNHDQKHGYNENFTSANEYTHLNRYFLTIHICIYLVFEAAGGYHGMGNWDLSQMINWM